jgi:uncharacterized SAM-binding protein YcdF (DUF218 family)
MISLVQLVPILVSAHVVGFLLSWRRRRKEGRRAPLALGVLTALLFLATWTPLSWVLAGTLEWQHTSAPRPDGDGDVIVVLSGAVFQPRSYRPVPVLGRDTYTRCRHAAWLHKNWRALPVLVSGGKNDARAPNASLAAAMAEYLKQEGVPKDSVWIEDRSRSTYENAVHCAELLAEKGIERVVLVTEGFHMPRAAACFRAQGLEVLAAPCGLGTVEFQNSFASWLPSYSAIVSNERVLHEWVGLAWYWVRGRL